MTPQIGDRIRLTAMPDDPDPIPVGTCGTVWGVQNGTFRPGELLISVHWDNKRTLMMVSPPDTFEILARDPT